ncbi:MAG: prepilin-type N-terminal cleavage/methylation domain-containing protein [Dehalococcoidales bacterium]|nr:prepilin-type N-terminal cleavage/methylation domain-containing protein [Dehalococcoidales bacterium]
MKHYISSLKTKCEGFTLIEILIVLLITGVLTSGVVTTIYQIFSQNERSTRNMVVVQNVESAGHWVNRDALMAQTVSAGGFPLTLSWQDWDGNDHQIVYSLVEDAMVRTEMINTVNVNQTTVACNVNTDSNLTDCSFADGILHFKVTATIDSHSETRVYEIKLRPEIPLQ